MVLLLKSNETWFFFPYLLTTNFFYTRNILPSNILSAELSSVFLCVLFLWNVSSASSVSRESRDFTFRSPNIFCFLTVLIEISGRLSVCTSCTDISNTRRKWNTLYVQIFTISHRVCVSNKNTIWNVQALYYSIRFVLHG